MTAYRCSLFTLLALFTTTTLFAQQQPPKRCDLPEQKQFDFWVGDWDLTTPGAKSGSVVRSSNTIKRILGGCIVQENFVGSDDPQQAPQLLGMSVSVFDPVSSKWKQTWVDNQGAYLDFTGEFKDSQMILSREATRPDGTTVLQRMVWKNITPNELDWSWERSKDNGKTWEVLWPVHYKRK
jgi:Protein of unknown function (DUF1579)